MNYFQQESQRLLFRKFTPADISDWTPFFINNDRLHFLGIDVNKTPKALATGWINKQFERYETEQLGHLAIVEKASNTFIGSGGIVPRTLDDKPVFEIAYSLLPKFWGNGFATEAAQQLKSFGFNKPIANQLVSIIHKDNLASTKVAKKNGMKPLYETIFIGMEVIIFGVDRK